MSTDSVAACPNCDSSVVYERANADPAWICYDCDEEFDTAFYRAPKSPGSTGGEADAESADESDADVEPTAGPLDTPDAVFADVEPGDTVQLSKADTGGYHKPMTVMEVRDRTVWGVPCGLDWCDADIILTQGKGLSGTAYLAEVTSAGSVELYRPLVDEHVRNSRKHVASVEAAERVGEVSTASKLQLLGRTGDGDNRPEGDDSWKQYYGEGAT